MPALFINGRFLTQRITGVQRFALETLLALDDLLSEDRERLIAKGRERLRYHSWHGSARAYLSMIEEWTGQPVGSHHFPSK
jgi:hypothetical protein